MNATDQAYTETLHIFRKLIAIDTTSHNSNIPAANLIADYLSQHGCTIDRFDSPDGHKTNMLAHKGPDKPGGLILSGHLDTVPATEPGWQTNPFELVDTPDRFLGRGTADMKAFVAIACYTIAHAPDNLTAPLVGLFTHDEEIGTRGSQAFVKQWDNRWILPNSAIIGEPTNMNVVRMHKGHCEFRLTATGQSAHSGCPHLGSNAIEKLGSAIHILTIARQRLESERNENSQYFPQTPYPVLNLAKISGGVAVNIIPDHATLDAGLRVLPGMNATDYIDQLRSELAQNTDFGDDITIEITGESPPMITEQSATIYDRLAGQLGQQETLAASYATDAGPLSTLGIECVICGPGSIEVAHKPNEFITKEQFALALENITKFANNWCTS